MGVQFSRTVWLPKDQWLAILAMIPLWGVAGMAWGGLMYLMQGDGRLPWFILGPVWGVSCWGLFLIPLVILCREVATTIPSGDTTALASRLYDAANSLRYSVDENSESEVICRPKRWLARRFECNAVHVRIQAGSLELIGPALIVKKLAKALGA
jgi:hypothetical protein